ncbi:MAG: type II secretion system protein GspG [bacterium]|nr:type II secretion system protein GspG [bacterium]
MSQKEKGFTLLEILVVIAVIGILVAILVPRFSGIQTDAKKKQAMSELRSLKTAVEIYKNNNNAYPAKAGWDTLLVNQTNRIIDEVPNDPFGTTKYSYDLDTTTSSYYVIYSVGPDGAPGTITLGADAVTASGAGTDNIWVSNVKTGNHNP